MESFRDDKLGFYVIIYKYNNERWTRAKDICSFLGYKDYKRAVQKHAELNNKKKPELQDKRYRCFFLNKSGAYSLVKKSRKTIKNKFLEWLENEVYFKKSNTSVRVHKRDFEAPKKFKTNP